MTEKFCTSSAALLPNPGSPYLVQIEWVQREGIKGIGCRSFPRPPFPGLSGAQIVRRIYIADFPISSEVLFQSFDFFRLLFSNLPCYIAVSPTSRWRCVGCGISNSCHRLASTLPSKDSDMPPRLANRDVKPISGLQDFVMKPSACLCAILVMLEAVLTSN